MLYIEVSLGFDGYEGFPEEVPVKSTGSSIDPEKVLEMLASKVSKDDLTNYVLRNEPGCETSLSSLLQEINCNGIQNEWEFVCGCRVEQWTSDFDTCDEEEFFFLVFRTPDHSIKVVRSFSWIHSYSRRGASGEDYKEFKKKLLSNIKIDTLQEMTTGYVEQQKTNKYVGCQHTSYIDSSEICITEFLLLERIFDHVMPVLLKVIS